MNSNELSGYLLVLDSIKEKISQSRLRAVLYVNYELVKVYWEIGNTINEQQEKEGWGAKVIEQLAHDLNIEFADMKGLSSRNLRYMRDFAKAYPDFLIWQQAAAKLENTDNKDNVFWHHPAAKIPWTHHMVILNKVHDRDERLFYITQTAENNWSRNVLALQIEGKLYQRTGKSLNNFNQTLALPQADLARETFKNPYLLDFINLGKEAQERDIENSLIEHLKSFLLELGRGFAYVGNQYNLEVGGDDFFLDLFFYNTRLHCYVIFELKVGEFKPEFAGKLNFYINTVDAQIKTDEDKPTIGVLLCKTPNETVIQYALKGINAPMGVSDYELTAALPKELKGEIPTIQELEQEIETEYEELKSPAEKKMDALKQKLANLKNEGIQTIWTKDILKDLYTDGLKPLYSELTHRLETLRAEFATESRYWQFVTKIYYQFKDIENDWENDAMPGYKLSFVYSLGALLKSGVNTINCSIVLTFIAEQYWYGFNLMNYNNQEPFIRKLYHQPITKEDRNNIIDTVQNFLVDDLESRIKNLEN